MHEQISRVLSNTIQELVGDPFFVGLLLQELEVDEFSPFHFVL
jgi:hypothetical protein